MGWKVKSMTMKNFIIVVISFLAIAGVAFGFLYYWNEYMDHICHDTGVVYNRHDQSVLYQNTEKQVLFKLDSSVSILNRVSVSLDPSYGVTITSTQGNVQDKTHLALAALQGALIRVHTYPCEREAEDNYNKLIQETENLSNQMNSKSQEMFSVASANLSAPQAKERLKTIIKNLNDLASSSVIVTPIVGMTVSPTAISPTETPVFTDSPTSTETELPTLTPTAIWTALPTTGDLEIKFPRGVDGTTLSVDNQQYSNLTDPMTITLQPGDHSVTVTKDQTDGTSYNPIYKTVNIQAGVMTSLNANLKILPAAFTLTIGKCNCILGYPYIYKCQVYIDGHLEGELHNNDDAKLSVIVPKTENILPGDHNYTIEYEIDQINNNLLGCSGPIVKQDTTASDTVTITDGGTYRVKMNNNVPELESL
jgi:hypothetical protein